MKENYSYYLDFIFHLAFFQEVYKITDKDKREISIEEYLLE
jgi:hypothetical protein